MSKKSLIERVQDTIRTRDLANGETPVLLMVSGGSDSTALAYIADELRKRGCIGQIAIMHLNHMLRGEHADADALFVARLAECLGVPLYTYSIDIAAKVAQSGENLEALARRERYVAAQDALEKLCLRAGLPITQGRIFTAHTRNDRVENFYMRSIVGTGPGGFRSMLYTNGPIARPLLDTERDELRDYVKLRVQDAEEDERVRIVKDEAGALWREDATNAHTDQFRAYVRHTIIPKALERNPRLFETLCRSMNLIADEDDMLERQVAQLLVVLRKPLAGARDYTSGCVIEPAFGQVDFPLQRRMLMHVLQDMLGADARVETRSIEVVLAAFEHGQPKSGYTANIQGDLAISSNKRGVRIEPMAAYRARRKPNKK